MFSGLDGADNRSSTRAACTFQTEPPPCGGLLHALLPQPCHQLRQRHGAALSGDFTAVAEQDQAGNRADAELRRQLCIGLAVELGQAAAALELTGSLRKGRGETAAGPHQLAQTSISSGRSPLIWLANWLCCRSNGAFGNASALHRPQRGASCSRSAGIRLRLAQCAQGTISDSVMTRLHGGMPLMWSLGGGYQARISPWTRSAPGPDRRGCRRCARYRWIAG